MQTCNYLIIQKGTRLETSSAVVKIILPCPDELFIESHGKNFAKKNNEKSSLLASYSAENRKSKWLYLPLVFQEIIPPISQRMIVMTSYIFHVLHAAQTKLVLVYYRIFRRIKSKNKALKVLCNKTTHTRVLMQHPWLMLSCLMKANIHREKYIPW